MKPHRRVVLGRRWLLAAALLVCACSDIRTTRVEDLEYHVLPELVSDPRISADSGLIARDGPLLVLHLREEGKRDFAMDMFPRKYHLEPVDSNASYVFNVRIKHITFRGGARANTYEIKRITKNRRQIYP